MIKKFKDFDVHEYLNGKDGLKESLNDNVNDDDVITGKAVYDDPYLFKIARILIKRIDRSGIGRYGMYHDIVYMNDMPGVWFYGIGKDKYDVVCFRDRNRKCVSIFKNFDADGDNKDIVTYSTEKLGFGDILDRVISSVKDGSLENDKDDSSVNESMAIFEAIKWHGSGCGIENIRKLKEMGDGLKIYFYGIIKDVKDAKSGSPSSSDYRKKIEELLVTDKNMSDVFSKIFGTSSPGDGPRGYLASLMWYIALQLKERPKGGPVTLSDPENLNYYVYAEYKTFEDTGKIADKAYIDGLIPSYSGTSASSSSSTTEPVEDETSPVSGTPSSIETTSGTTYSSSSVDPAREARLKDIERVRKARIEGELDKYNSALNLLRKVTSAMCSYVKNNKKLNSNEQAALRKRGILLTGLGGIGKSYTVKQVLKERGMVPDKDYMSFGNGSTSAEDMYKAFYDYNGKLIIFDDSPKLFSGEYRITFWKAALNTDQEDRIVKYPSNESTMPLNVYKADDASMTRQQRYYLEMGRKTDKDRMDFFKREMHDAKIRNITRLYDGGIEISGIKGITRVDASIGEKKDYRSEEEVIDAMWAIAQKWKEESKDATPAMPNKFEFDGVVIIITNSTRAEFVKDMGKEHWKAIESRFTTVDISPSSEIIWINIKNKILEEYENESISDDFRIIPKDLTNEFIDEVEKLLRDTNYQNLSWRTIKAMSLVLRAEDELPTWKKTLANEMIVYNYD